MKRLLVLLAAVAAAVALAGVYLPSDAATVGAGSISRSALDADLSAISKSADYSCFLAEERALAGQRQAPLRGVGVTAATSPTSGIYGTRFTDDWLGSMITDRVVTSVDARQGLTVTPSDVALGRSVLTRRITGVLQQYAQGTGAQGTSCGGNGAAVLASLPKWFAEEQSTAEAAQALLDAKAAGAGLDDGALAEYYSRHGAAFDRFCVSVIVVKTESAATAAKKAIAGGTTFASEAQAVSITGGDAANGGQAGCGVIVGTFLAAHLDSAAVNAVTGPFKADGVWWLAMATKRTGQPLAAVRNTVVTAILQSGQGRADAELAGALRATALGIDPSYGRAAGHRVTLIKPPAAPPAGSVISVAANTPSTSTSS